MGVTQCGARALIFALSVTIVAACSSPEPSAETEPSPATTQRPTTTLAPTTTQVAPEDAHILEGEWLLTYTLEDVSADFSPGFDVGDRDVRIVEVTPGCSTGPCDVEGTYRIPYGEEESGVVPWQWLGDRYELNEELPGQGDCTLGDGTLLEGGLDLSTTIELQPSEFVSNEGVWLVTELTGTRFREWTPTEEAVAAGCESSFEEQYSVLGSPLDSEALRVPTSDPLRPGSVLYYQWDPRGLFAWQADGTQVELAMGGSQFALSPDGRTLVYGGGPGLRIMAVDGSDSYEFFPLARVTTSSELSWSPDGTKVAFVRSNRNEGADVWYVEVPYGVPERLTSGGGALGGVTWGSEGDTLLFDWGINEGEMGTGQPPDFQVESTIYHYDLDTEEITEVVTNGFRPNISPDGSALTYLVPQLLGDGRPILWSIVVAEPNGTNSRSVLTANLARCGLHGVSQGVHLPCSVPVSPDGTSLVFPVSQECVDCPPGFDDAGLWIWDIASGQRTQIADEGWKHPQWSR